MDDRAQGAGGVGDGAGAIPDHLVDAFFDRELDESARRAFLRRLPSDLARCEEVASTRRMLDMLKGGASGADRMCGVPAGPDLTGKIIAAVDARRGFASRRVRRLAGAVRLGLAAGLVLVVGAVAAVERVNPDATRLAPAPAPLTSAVRETQSEMATALGSLSSTFETILLRVDNVRVQGVPPSRGADHDGWTPEDEHVQYALSVSGADDHDPGMRTISIVARVDAHGRLARDGEPGMSNPAREGEPGGWRRPSMIGLAYSSKSDPRTMVWQADMAPGGVAWREGGPRAASREALRGAARLIDADGRCSGMVVPLGVDRGEALGGTFVLPGCDSASRSWSGASAPTGVLAPPRLP